MNRLGLIDFLVARGPELWDRTIEHLVLTGSSTGIAILLGVPLGVWIVRAERVRGAVLGGASVVQTIPSLAMLAFLLPFLGIGAQPAIVALTLYALLPIVRNTYTGLSSVPPALQEAAFGLGFTRGQRLWLVELPLALPIVVAGIRTAAVIGVGIATLAAFIGAGGLGDFINRGLALNDARLVLLGALPAGVLALLIDRAIGLAEAWLRAGRRPPRLVARTVMFAALLVLLAVGLGLLVVAEKRAAASGPLNEGEAEWVGGFMRNVRMTAYNRHSLEGYGAFSPPCEAAPLTREMIPSVHPDRAGRSNALPEG